MKIGILQTGRTPDEMRSEHGDYDDLFKQLLHGRGFMFETYPVLDGTLPNSIHDAEGWLITGSKFGVYEDHEWIAPLEEFLRQAFAAGVPIVGICFGHQILAQALGGKVEKYTGGWQVGATDYVGADGSKETMIAWHRDQVTQLPEGAEVIGASEFCENAMLVYGDRALTVQPHPEFTSAFAADLLEARRDVLPGHIAQGAEACISEPLTSLNYVDRIVEFLKRGQPSSNN